MGSNLKSDIKNTHNWQWTTLGDVAEFINGDRGKNYPSSLDRVEKGIPFINTGHIEPTGRLSDIRMEYITREKYDKLGSGKVQPGDIVYCLRGSTIGKTAINSYSEGAIASSLIIIRAKDNICQGYLYYFLTSPVGQGLATINDNGSAQPNLSGRVLASYPLQIPNYQTQVSITKLLSGLDKKIHLNNETNETLEQMAQALFKSWFVDFDPVFDNLLASVDFNLDNLETSLPEELKQKAQRRLAALNSLHNAAEIKTSLSALAHELQAQLPIKEATQSAVSAAETPVKVNFNANPKILAQHANTHAHFPNEFEHSEQLGWIPKGWEVLPLESLIILIGGGTPKTSIEEYWNGDIPWFSVVDAPQDSDVFVVDTEKHVTQLGVDKSSTKILRVGTTIISARGTVGKCAFVGTPMAMNQSCYGINGKNNISDEFIYYLTRHQVSDLQKRGHGSVFNTITRETFKSILLSFSGEKLTEEFGKAVTSLFDKILMNNHQNIELTKLRDTLLPKLISGELQIPDVATDEEVVD